MSSAWKNENLASKLMLTTALVVVSAGYVYWQGGVVRQEQAAAIAAMQTQAPPAQVPAQSMTAAPAAPQTAAPQTAAPQTAAPQSAAAQSAVPGASAPGTPDSAAPSPAAAPKSTTLAMAAPQPAAPAPGAAPQSGTTQNVLLPAKPPPPLPPMALTGMAAIQAFIPTEGVSPPLPPTTGEPDPGATPPIPAGNHLEDGDYESDKVPFEWGDLRVKIMVTGGKITGVQIMSYPDHRSQSLYLIQLADPILNSEVIKTQQARVNVVSSATASSIAFQDAITNAMMKATH